MIKHLGEGLVPFEDCGFSRKPVLPLIGDEVTVCCRMDDHPAVPVLLWDDGAGERTILGQTEDGRYYAFSLGAFDSCRHVTYRFVAGTEESPRYGFDVLRRERITVALNVRRAASGMRLALAEDLSWQIDQNGWMTLTQEPWGDLMENCAAITMAGGETLCAGTDCLWELKRLSIPLIRVMAVEVLRDAANAVRHVRLEIRLTCRHVLGTGERFDAVDQFGRGTTGRVTEKFTHQGDQTYLPMPFFFTEQNWGWYRAGSIPADMRFGETTFIAQETEGPVLLRDRLLTGTPDRMLADYLAMTGPCVLPPQWAFGVWISGNGWNCDAEVDAQLAALKRFRYPASVMVLEQWSDERTFWRWHPEHWEDPAQTVKNIRAAGLHLLLWQIPVIKHEWDGEAGAELERDTEEAIRRGLAVRSADGSPYRITENWFHHSLLPDFTNPETVAWWFSRRKYLLDMGVEGFKTDGGEFLFENAARLHNGESGLAAHNLYPVQYARAYHDFLKENGVDGVTFSRAGFAGAQSVPVHWAGDQKSEWAELASQLKAGISAGISGLIFWSFDIGGFAGPIPDAELYLRATAMGCFSPVMQWHSEPRGGQFGGEQVENNDRSPWNLAQRLQDPRVLEIGCAFARLREKLRPYLWREAQNCVRAGRPMMAHLCLDNPEDAEAWRVDDEYLLGRELLVAPVTEPGATGRSVYLPRGTWRDEFTAETFTGPRRMDVVCPLDRIPVYRKESTP